MVVTGKGLLAGMLIGLAFAASASASVIPKMSMQEVFATSDTVVQGTVIAQRSEWKQYDGNRLIFTYSTIDISNTWKRGAPDSGQIVVRSVGGMVDGYHQTLIGEASITLGEEVVVFLQDESDWTHPSVVGFYQGKYRVERDAAGEIASLSRDRGQLPGAIARLDQRISFKSFEQRISTLAAQGAAPARNSDASADDAKDGAEIIHPLVPQRR